MSRQAYFRKIDLWAATTGVEENLRGIRLLQELKGEAFEKLDKVDTAILNVANGINVFKELIENAYEPIEDYRMGKVMDDFLFH